MIVVQQKPPEIRFPSLPLWRGVVVDPKPAKYLPFYLGCDPGGFIRQTTPEHVRKLVIAAYDREDYSFVTRPPGGSDWATRLGDEKIGALTKHLGSLDGLRILEIGAGSLYIAERLLKAHDIARYVVVDPAVTDKPQDPRLTSIRGFYPHHQLKGLRFDLAIAFSCLEHVDDPLGFLKDLREHLEPCRGRIFLTFPDVGRQFAEGDLCAVLHEHMLYLDRSSTMSLFAAAGLLAKNLESSNDLFRCLATVDRDRSPSASCLDDVQTVLTGAARAFRQNIEERGSEIRSRIDGGERVAFHGANPGLYNFLHLTGLCRERNILIYDGDASKKDRFLPGSPVPIRLSTEPGYCEVDRIYVAATSFYSEILTSLTESHGIDSRRIEPLFCCDTAQPAHR